jgi:D-glycero-D-manno-heptose 1,7-bisphosphate phosphatase
MIKDYGNDIGFILDRDGVINVKGEELCGSKYILNPSDLSIYPDFLEFAAWADKSDREIFVATNQQALGLNLLSSENLELIHLKIQMSLDILGVKRIKNFYVCGHLDGTCKCRKPEPGLLLDIVKESSYSQEDLIFVGDSYSDKSAADRANIRFIQLRRDPKTRIFGNEHISSLCELIAVGS